MRVSPESAPHAVSGTAAAASVAVPLLFCVAEAANREQCLFMRAAARGTQSLSLSATFGGEQWSSTAPSLCLKCAGAVNTVCCYFVRSDDTTSV